MRVGWKLAIFISVLTAFVLAGAAGAQEGADSERGAELFQAYCAMCHGADGRGRIGANLQAFPGIAVDAAIQETVANGVQGSVMPAFSQAKGGPLSDVDITDIAAYLTGVLEGTEPIAPAPEYIPPQIPPLPDVEGDPGNGALVFAANCAGCHGEKAQGGFGWPLAKNWPGNQPEVFINQVVSTGIAGTVMPGWSQDAGGPLSPEEIEDVTAYILTLEPASGLPETGEAASGPLRSSISVIIFGLLAVVVAVVLIRYYQKA